MPKAKDKTVTKETVHFDDGDYENCIFEECQMVYSGGTPPRLVGCAFNDCGWTFYDAAARTIRLMGALYSAGGAAAAMIEVTFENIRGNPGAGVTIH